MYATTHINKTTIKNNEVNVNKCSCIRPSFRTCILVLICVNECGTVFLIPFKLHATHIPGSTDNITSV